jgi:YVTN family beta-propeller protein
MNVTKISRSVATSILLQAALCTAAFSGDVPPPGAEYAVSGVWPLGGSGGWDYLALEPSGARLFLSRGDHVDVVESASGRRAGVIAHTDGVHGIAFDPARKRGFTSNGRSNTVTAFALDTLETIQESPVAGQKPDAILFEPRFAHVLTANGASSDIDVLDPGTLKVVATIALPGKPEFMATDGAGTVFVNIEADMGSLVAIDAKSLKAKAAWSLPGCANPTGLAIDPKNHRLFSTCANGVMAVTDSSTGTQVAQVAIGAGPDAAAFDADLQCVFSSNGADGTLTVIHQDAPDRYRVVQTLKTRRSARTMALDHASHAIYLAAATLGDPPAPSADNPHPRAPIVPESFVVLIARPK